MKALTSGKLSVRYSPVYVLLLLLVAIAFLSATSPVGSALSKLYKAASFSYTRLFMVFLLVNFIGSRRVQCFGGFPVRAPRNSVRGLRR